MDRNVTHATFSLERRYPAPPASPATVTRLRDSPAASVRCSPP